MKTWFPCRASARPLVVALFATSVALTACGGGGGNDSGLDPSVSNVAPNKPAGSAIAPVPASAAPAASTPAAVTPSPAVSAPAAVTAPSAATPASGTGTSSGSEQVASTGGSKPDNTETNDLPASPPVAINTVPITVDNKLDATIVNAPYVSVTICVPGAQGPTQCATLDHMLLDTGSSGVRVISSALGAALAARLPAQTGAGNDPTGNAALAQCAIFASGYTWGPIRRADVKIGGETASNIPIQVIGDSGFTWTPNDCTAHGASSMNDVKTLGAKGIVGIGHLAHDFPQAAQTALAATYYYCPTPWSCTAASVPLDRQTANPVAAFATDNNGTVIRLPALPATGEASVTGKLLFGIGTRDNNTLPSSATRLTVTDRGLFTTNYKGRTLSSVIDSGSNGLFFADSTLPVFGGWYAPPAAQTLSASMLSNTGNAQSTASFAIADSSSLFELGYAAHDNLGAPLNSMFMWGLPFFYGRSVYTALSGVQAGPQTGPYVAF
ncbi:DUF3443 family protein [Paraburkholderia phymatum]|uniref:Lipoprotein n=1 Tax=Paraburkholderia phymatum (strain DSM 17167 / CIP 108236 / LMG 21445 / STM815) TaxID=391038 RepID=B2JF56_PARP8|nr:DUF3443 family protein [Paraburkholderia phymatum]ACC71424.1 conserved hypothetical protein [Paraburkholderia phymatum STM815]